jgi:antitoxin (DNA-binding transcriptional repressor) of toxin-antitoxin stability system
MHESVISATALARHMNDVLGRIRNRGESFIVERRGSPVARIGPVDGTPPGTVREALAAWVAASPTDPDLAADLERIGGSIGPADRGDVA